MITYEALEDGIFVYHWVGLVDMDEARQSFEQLKAQLLTKQPYVSIVDMSQIKRVPNDIAGMRALIKREVALGLKGYVMLGAPRTVRSLISAVAALAPTTYQFADEWDEALAMARDLLRS